jgi:hypothetical protein
MNWTFCHSSGECETAVSDEFAGTAALFMVGRQPAIIAQLITRTQAKKLFSVSSNINIAARKSALVF